jgi:hypothetical protein
MNLQSHRALWITATFRSPERRGAVGHPIKMEVWLPAKTIAGNAVATIIRTGCRNYLHGMPQLFAWNAVTTRSVFDKITVYGSAWPLSWLGTIRPLQSMFATRFVLAKTLKTLAPTRSKDARRQWPAGLIAVSDPVRAEVHGRGPIS